MPKRDNTHIQDKVVELLEKGYGRVSICDKIGISLQSLINWENKNVDFLERTKKAQLQGMLKRKEAAENAVLKAFEKSWQSAAWYLERKHSDEYGKQITVSGVEEIKERLIIE